MSFLKKNLFIFTVIITIGLLAYSTWHQWSDNQTTNVVRMKPIPPIATFVQGRSIKYIAYDPKNPNLIAAAGSGNIVKIWNLNREDTPQLTLNTQKGHDGTNFIVGLGFSPVNDWIAIKGFWILEIWDITSSNIVNTLHRSSVNFAISPVGNNFALDSSHITLWDVNDPKNIKGKYLLPPKMGWEVIALDGLERRDPFPEKRITMIRHNIPNSYRNASVNENYRGIDFSHDGKWLAAAGQMLNDHKGEWRQKIKIWELQKHQLYKIMYRDDSEMQESKRKEEKVPANRSYTSNDIRSIEFSPDNRFFGLAADNGFTIWSLPDWEIYHEVVDQQISDITISPDGTMFAVCDVKGITLWSVDTLTPIALLATGGLLGSSIIEFSPDGRTLAGGGYGGLLQIWDASEFYEN